MGGGQSLGVGSVLPDNEVYLTEASNGSAVASCRERKELLAFLLGELVMKDIPKPPKLVACPY